MKTIPAIALAMALCPAMAFAQGIASSPVGTMPLADADFARTAATSGLAEVQAGRLAMSHGTGQAKAIGQQMVDEHTKVNMELTRLAKARGMVLPLQPDDAHKATLAALQQVSGKAFNDLYLTGQVSDHHNSVMMFQTEADQGTDPGMKAFAAKTLPSLQQHTRRIEAASGSK